MSTENIGSEVGGRRNSLDLIDRDTIKFITTPSEEEMNKLGIRPCPKGYSPSRETISSTEKTIPICSKIFQTLFSLPSTVKATFKSVFINEKLSIVVKDKSGKEKTQSINLPYSKGTVLKGSDANSNLSKLLPDFGFKALKKEAESDFEIQKNICFSTSLQKLKELRSKGKDKDAEAKKLWGEIHKTFLKEDAPLKIDTSRYEAPHIIKNLATKLIIDDGFDESLKESITQSEQTIIAFIDSNTEKIALTKAGMQLEDERKRQAIGEATFTTFKS